MKILNYVKEAFDPSMPSNVRKWMQQFGDRSYSSSNRQRADYFRDFDPSTAKFTDYSNESVRVLRDRLKAGEIVLFAELEDEWNNIHTIAIYSDRTNSTNMLKLVGHGAEKFKEKSFKWIVENAISLYGADTSQERVNVQAARRDARKGLISREGQPQATDGRYSFDGADWKKDASGYWYDANRLAKKLAALHESDGSYYVKKAADIFKTMADDYAAAIQRMAANINDYTLDTFGHKSFNRISRDGQRILEDSARLMERINEYAEIVVMSLEDYNKERAARDAEPVDQETFEDSVKYDKNQIIRTFAELKQKQRELREDVTLR